MFARNIFPGLSPPEGVELCPNPFPNCLKRCVERKWKQTDRKWGKKRPQEFVKISKGSKFEIFEQQKKTDRERSTAAKTGKKRFSAVITPTRGFQIPPPQKKKHFCWPVLRCRYASFLVLMWGPLPVGRCPPHQTPGSPVRPGSPLTILQVQPTNVIKTRVVCHKIIWSFL